MVPVIVFTGLNVNAETPEGIISENILDDVTNPDIIEAEIVNEPEDTIAELPV